MSEHALAPVHIPPLIVGHIEHLTSTVLFMDDSCVACSGPVKNTEILRKPEWKKYARDYFQQTILPRRVGGFMPEEVKAINIPEWEDVYDPFLGPYVLIIDDSLFILSAVVKEDVFENTVKRDSIMKDYFQCTILPRDSENACSLKYFKDGKLVGMLRFIVNVSDKGRCSKRYKVPEHVWLQVSEAGKKRREVSEAGKKRPAPYLRDVLGYS